MEKVKIDTKVLEEKLLQDFLKKGRDFLCEKNIDRFRSGRLAIDMALEIDPTYEEARRLQHEYQSKPQGYQR